MDELTKYSFGIANYPEPLLGRGQVSKMSHVGYCNGPIPRLQQPHLSSLRCQGAKSNPRKNGAAFFRDMQKVSVAPVKKVHAAIVVVSKVIFVNK